VNKLKNEIRPIFIIIALLVMGGVLVYHNYQILKLTEMINSMRVIIGTIEKITIGLVDVVTYLFQKLNNLRLL